ncbi:MAG: HAMP domain-containing sensor histidine kinase, partial [Sutterella wadsworthensis]|nr:HAMP domain-containing sensor histidine kinase [Sutterella wadsworthensis]
LKRRSTPQTLPIVEQLGRTSSTISTLVEQVLEVTRMEFGRLELHPEVIWLPELMEELSHDFTAIAAEKGLRFRVKSVPAAVCTDPLLLKRALKNLITNAIRYTDKPGAEVVVGARRLGSSRVSIGVYDAGPGLTTEDKARIFETFYRGSAGKKSTSEGFGLGLSIVKRICRQLGIEFSMGSKLGRGSVFRLVLNLTEGEQVEMLERPGAPAVINSRLGGTTALLEDNPFVNEALSAKLSLWGTDVVAAPAFSEDFVKRVQASAGKTGRLVLLTDYNLGAGELTGLEASTELSSRLGMNVPTVLLTAVAGDLIEADWTQARKKGKAGRMPEVLPQIL